MSVLMTMAAEYGPNGLAFKREAKDSVTLGCDRGPGSY